MAIQACEGGKGWLVESCGHGNPENEPRKKKSASPVRQSKHTQAEREDKVRRAEHRASATLINEASGKGT